MAKNHWAFDYIDALVDKKVVNGYEDGTFRPNKNVTRAEWAKMLTVTAEIPNYSNYKSVIDFCSEDVKSDNWAAPYLTTVLPFFPFEGTESPYGKISVKFQPAKAATRLEITKSIVMEKGYSLKKPNYNLVTSFTDYLDIPEEDMAYVAVAVEHGIIKGMDDGSFKPNKNVTRAEAATILYRAYIGEKEVAEVKKPYSMSTLVSAEIDSMMMSTLDSLGNLYYIDKADNMVYKMSMRDRKKVEYYDISELEYEDETGSYSGYVAKQVFWDNGTGTLLLNGYFTNCEKPGAKPVSDGAYTYFFDISDVKDVDMYFTISDKWSSLWINAVVSGEYMILCKNAYIYKYKFDGKREQFYGIIGSGHYVEFHQVDNDLYFFDSSEDYYYGENHPIHKYDFSKGMFVSVSENISYGANGFKNGYLYYVDREDKIMYKVNLKTLNFESLNIKIDDENIDFTDMTNMKKLYSGMHVINDSTYIFYDYGIKAFRILESTASTSEDDARLYDDDFYSFYDSYLPD